LIYNSKESPSYKGYIWYPNKINRRCIHLLTTALVHQGVPWIIRKPENIMNGNRVTGTSTIATVAVGETTPSTGLEIT
jgi:hypothetical protein